MSLIIFDADGTLRRCTVEGQPCPNQPDQWELMPSVKKVLAIYDWSKVAMGIASNQAGVALGYMSKEMAYQLLCDMVVEATGYFPPTGSIQLCPHRPDAGCACRKPGTLMLERLMDFWDVSPKQTWMVGDMESDKQAAERAGVAFIWAHEFFKAEKQFSVDFKA